MNPRQATPKSVILDLLRVAPARPSVPVSDLLALGDLFGFTANATRVAITRLVRTGLLVSPRRGHYRLAATTAPVNRFVDEWQLGEERVRPWKGRWLAIFHPGGTARGDGARSRRAMELVGFRRGLDGLWVRPDNLSQRRPALAQRLASMGLHPEAELIAADGFSPARTARWANTLWNISELRAEHRAARHAIENSLERMAEAARDSLLVDSFLVGGRAIRSLALDPLLPEDICPPGERRALTDAMRHYDRVGRDLWAAMLGDASLSAAPTHLSATGEPTNA